MSPNVLLLVGRLFGWLVSWAVMISKNGRKLSSNSFNKFIGIQGCGSGLILTTSQDKPDPDSDPDTSFLKILNLFYDEF